MWSARSSSTSASAGWRRAPGNGASPRSLRLATSARLGGSPMPTASPWTSPTGHSPRAVACRSRSATPWSAATAPTRPPTPLRSSPPSVGSVATPPERALLDRDLVVRWPVAESQVGLSVQSALRGDGLYGLLTLVPPRPGAGVVSIPRDLIVLLDTSGSMSGEPLDQARR